MAAKVDKFYTAAIHGSKHQDNALRDLLYDDFNLPRDKKELCKLMTNFRIQKQTKLVKIVSQDQWNLFCPANGETDLNKLDISSLAIIFRNLQHIVPNFHAQLKLKAERYKPYIKQACKDRNILSHPGREAMTKDVFVAMMERMTHTLIGMKYSKTNEFNEWKTCPIFGNELKEEIPAVLEKFFKGK